MANTERSKDGKERKEGERHHPKFKHYPVTHEAQFKSYDFNKLHAKYFNIVTETTQMHDIGFHSNGTFKSRSTPCSDGDPTEIGHQWSSFPFIKPDSIEGLRKLDRSTLGDAPLDIMSEERKRYLFDEIRQYVRANRKTYS